MRTLRAPLLAAIAAILLGACAMAGAGASSTPVANQVTISGFAFSPNSLSIRTGTTVTWKNNDPMAHTATSVSGTPAFDSGTLANGASYSFTFATAGTWTYKCSFHSSMSGTITVTP